MMEALRDEPAGHTIHALTGKLPSGPWGAPTENRAYKVLVRLRARGYVWNQGVGKFATWFITQEGRQALE
jgi:hypothetical protein